MLLQAALWYAGQGLKIFPLRPLRKVPYGGFHWREKATNDRGQIAAWWKQWPTSNIGIATGHLVDVIDVDGGLGVIAWARMANLPPIIGTVSTPRNGGTHLYIAPVGLGNRAKMVPGLDYRGDGGYVVAPPSYVVVDPEPSKGKKGYEGQYTWRRPPAAGLPARTPRDFAIELAEVA